VHTPVFGTKRLLLSHVKSDPDLAVTQVTAASHSFTHCLDEYTCAQSVRSCPPQPASTLNELRRFMTASQSLGSAAPAPSSEQPKEHAAISPNNQPRFSHFRPMPNTVGDGSWPGNVLQRQAPRTTAARRALKPERSSTGARHPRCDHAPRGAVPVGVRRSRACRDPTRRGAGRFDTRRSGPAR